MRLIPLPQSESSVALLGVSTSAWPAPIEAVAGRAVVQRLFVGSPNCHPLRLTAELPVLNSSIHSRFVSAFCGSYMISLRITSARRPRATVHKTNASVTWATVALIRDRRLMNISRIIDLTHFAVWPTAHCDN